MILSLFLLNSLRRFLNITDERILTLFILQRVLEENAFLSPLLLYHSKKLDFKKRKFLQKLCYETLKNLIFIDHIIKIFYKGKFDKLEPFVRTALRVSLTELLILKRKPYAVCDSWVEIVKKRNIGASKLVNGILRNILRKGVPEFEEEWIKYSIPRWLFKKLERDFGKDFALNFAKWYHSEPPYYFRIYFKGDENKVRQEIENSYLKKDFPLSRFSFPPYCYKSFYHPWEADIEENYYYVQDFSSQAVMHYYDFKNIKYVWDMTSAPGGKSLYLSFLLNNKVKILATELRKGRVKILKENFEKYRIKGWVVNADATQFLPEKEFDLIVIDAPCSGLGTIRKKPEILLRMTPEKIKKLSRLQEKLIDNGFKALKKGGYLFYITCTITREENQGHIQNIAGKFDFELTEPKVPEFLISNNYFFCNGIEMDSDFMFGMLLKKL